MLVGCFLQIGEKLKGNQFPPALVPRSSSGTCAGAHILIYKSTRKQERRRSKTFEHCPRRLAQGPKALEGTTRTPLQVTKRAQLRFRIKAYRIKSYLCDCVSKHVKPNGIKSHRIGSMCACCIWASLPPASRSLHFGTGNRIGWNRMELAQRLQPSLVFSANFVVRSELNQHVDIELL